jgi:hypothetical protein
LKGLCLLKEPAGAEDHSQLLGNAQDRLKECRDSAVEVDSERMSPRRAGGNVRHRRSRETEGFCGNPPIIPAGPDIVSYLSVVTYDELFYFLGIYRPENRELSIDPNRSYFVQPVALEVASNCWNRVKLATSSGVMRRLRTITGQTNRRIDRRPANKWARFSYRRHQSSKPEDAIDRRGRRNRKEHHVPAV